LVPEFIVEISSSEKGKRLHLAAAKSAKTVSAPGVKDLVPDFGATGVAGVAAEIAAGIAAGVVSWCPWGVEAANMPTCLSARDLLPIN
jgi:hypothetical protein